MVTFGGTIISASSCRHGTEKNYTAQRTEFSKIIRQLLCLTGFKHCFDISCTVILEETIGAFVLEVKVLNQAGTTLVRKPVLSTSTITIFSIL